MGNWSHMWHIAPLLFFTFSKESKIYLKKQTSMVFLKPLQKGSDYY